MHHLFIDLETFSDVDIGKCGLYKYAQSPAFQILLFAYSLDGAPVQVVDLTQPGTYLPQEVLRWLFDKDCVKHAYNAAFEWYCLTRHFKLPEAENYDGFSAITWLSQWQCSMLHGMYVGYPAGLDAIGRALGLPEDKQKLSAGRALIRYFCVPCTPTKSNGGRTRNLPQHDPAKWELFKTYNGQDVVTEMKIDRRLENFPVPEETQQQWVMDQIINLRGVAVDMELADSAIYLGQTVQEQLSAEARELSGLQNPNSVAQLTKWLQEETGEDLTDLRKDTVSDLLGKDLPSDAARRMLEIRKELGKTSTKKYNAVEACVCADGRIRGLLQFYGASRTGREAGRLVQVQNLPHDVVPAMDLARQLVKTRQLGALRLTYGSVTSTLSALIRTVFVAAPGKTFIDADFSAIEARVIAWLAGEEWVLEVFRTHGKIYEATASQMFSIPFDRIKKGNPEYSYRAKGKVATLALGYQGSSGALINMGALRSGLTEDELPDIVDRWRRSNPAIVNFWYQVEAAALAAIQDGRSSTVGCVTISRECDPGNGLDFMTIKLPSGRKLYYASPHMGVNRFGKPSICYKGQNQTTKKWETLETYGGKLVENITQAVARDCLFYSIEQLTAAGYRIVFDIHDEVVIEAPAGLADLDQVVEIMSRPIPWAPGLPLNADGWVDGYFKKD
ncbi:MAG: DNA polymerase [Dysosmobacter sp.]|nr:DNA polymerase [Dysosmobacter sp.]